MRVKDIIEHLKKLEQELYRGENVSGQRASITESEVEFEIQIGKKRAYNDSARRLRSIITVIEKTTNDL